MKKIHILHPYIENRLNDITNGLYPRHHLWGLEGLSNNDFVESSLVKSNAFRIPKILERILNKILFDDSSSLSIELTAIKASFNCDLLYSVCGPLALARFHSKRCKLVSWVFRMPKFRKRAIFHSYKSNNLSLHDGFLCLTPNCAKDFSSFGISKFLPWCVDRNLFYPKKECDNSPKKPFFLATGKTGRDYATLIKAACEINADFRIIGPINQRPHIIPKNVKWISGTQDPPDKAIDYLTLRKWYSSCLAVCIPLGGDKDDTCGYTNMLEAMAMAKPVVMTRSGCLHIDPEKDSFGLSVNPKDKNGWIHSLNSLLNNPELTHSLGSKGLEMVNQNFTIEAFDNKIIDFLTGFLALGEENGYKTK